MDRIGIMGGTFNPIHYGHLRAAESARERFNLKKVIFVPAYKPPHKGDEIIIAPPQDRYAMVLLAISSHPQFSISDIELKRGGRSYTYLTIKEFHRNYPKTEIFFITGADAIAQLPTWKNAEELISLCRFIAVSRPNYKLEIPNNFFSNTYILEISGFDISSTLIREKIKAGESIKYLLPEEVEVYIYKNNLYK
jgi:nicotinate-nucleotide adenylyltransferase